MGFLHFIWKAFKYIGCSYMQTTFRVYVKILLVQLQLKKKEIWAWLLKFVSANFYQIFIFKQMIAL